jgi:lysozyme
MTTAQATLQILIPLLKQFEGCRLLAYQDIVGIWTIGYGETKGVTEGLKWTQEKADTELAIRAQEFLNNVLKACPSVSNLPPNKQAACVSLAYNIGVGAFSKSTVARKITEGKLTEAAEAFMMWNKAGGKVVKGLDNRRHMERVLFLKD